MALPAPRAQRGWDECLPGSPGYPVLLQTISSPPALVVRGKLDPGAPMMAIVGARRCTAYGADIAYELAMDLCGLGFTVVSGLARGIDAAAHRGALDAGGRTIAVMGTGPDTIYPSEHRDLAAQIAASGALLTQFAAGVKPLPQHFPIRNTTISGLCIGVVVVEARRQSGAMLTASAAANQGRTVMAVPGSIHNPASRGCHDLLRDGAAVVTNAAEVLLATQLDPLFQLLVPPEEPEGPAFGDARDEVLKFLRTGAMTLEGLVEGIGASVDDVVTAVASLRLDQRIDLRDGCYALVGSRRRGNKRAPDLVV